ncbi:MAG: hypothetical protein AB8B43_04125 [Prochlorococcus sp.]
MNDENKKSTPLDEGESNKKPRLLAGLFIAYPSSFLNQAITTDQISDHYLISY